MTNLILNYDKKCFILIDPKMRAILINDLGSFVDASGATSIADDIVFIIKLLIINVRIAKLFVCDLNYPLMNSSLNSLYTKKSSLW